MNTNNEHEPTAIVYTSNAGHTELYARLFGSRTGLSVYAFREAENQLAKGTPILYFGWIQASRVKGYSEAAKRFSVCAVCGVGLCDTGTMLSELRGASMIPDETPLFTLQGGIDRGRLKGVNKLIISMLARGLASRKQRSAQEERMLEQMQTDADYFSEDNLAGILSWYEKEYKIRRASD